VISLWIEGQPPRKSNSRRIVTNRQTKKPMLIKSREALNWVKRASHQIPPELRDLRLGSQERPLTITFLVVYKTRRPDLSVELILDTLQRTGVISDDRHAYEHHVYKEFDADNPGVEVFIEYQDETQWRKPEFLNEREDFNGE
jgi:Holliday junction resolvase RusA-like endonuclease